MNCTDWNEFENLEDLNAKLKSYIYDNYINELHSSLENTPNNVWQKDIDVINFLDSSRIDTSFLHTDTKKVRNDSTIQHNKQFYEVPYKYVKQTITIKYDPFDLSKVYIYDDNFNLLHVCNKVDTISNSKVKRKDNIDYSKIINVDTDAIDMEDEENV